MAGGPVRTRHGRIRTDQNSSDVHFSHSSQLHENPSTCTNEDKSESDSDHNAIPVELPTIAVDPFANIMRGSFNELISPNDCIPLACIRKLSKSGVCRLAAIFDGNTPGTGMSRGHSSSGVLPIVVKLSRAQRNIVITYFMQEYQLSQLQAEEKHLSRPIWYGIVDGAHRNAAFRLLMERKPERWGATSTT